MSKLEWLTATIGVIIMAYGFYQLQIGLFLTPYVGLGMLVATLGTLGVWLLKQEIRDRIRHPEAVGAKGSGSLVTQVLRDYPYQQAVYGTAAWEVHQLGVGDAQKDLERSLRGE